NSLRSLRELRSNNRGESEGRSALRARAGTAALLGCARARRQRTARAFADTVAARAATASAVSANALNPVSSVHRAPSTLPGRQAAAGRKPAGLGEAGPGQRGGSPAGWGDVGGAEQRSLGVGARSALRTL